ncbi:hypothetical protein CDO44_23150 [Pigmentiphaga sp. NML080357]|uniref:YidH family protein n=1 Tax=Pigmentiphaga sp. NML080357 TaxID=2008675 RepID=UPI000B41D6B2|nr:DUF202 domain-containing protein [Pigmentiphaga sp. NML080357]OVZ55139.1 hypothetical protein CDO44_23150 [Pigmentiphaga sp. NML080357]
MQENEGHEPDYRFTLANERTFLAWIRTALAVLAGAILLHQFGGTVRPHWPLIALSAAMTLAGLVFCSGAYFQWKANQQAMRHSRPLPRSTLIPLAAGITMLVAAVAGVFVLIQ